MKLTSNFISTLLVVLLTNPGGYFAPDVTAHGAMETPQELARRAEHVNQARSSLAKCSEVLATRERIEQRLRRRNALVDQFVEMKKRDGVESEHCAFLTLSITIDSNAICMGILTNHGHILIVSLNPALEKRDLSGTVDVKSLFSTNKTCVLAPELTIGPYCTYT